MDSLMLASQEEIDAVAFLLWARREAQMLEMLLDAGLTLPEMRVCMNGEEN